MPLLFQPLELVDAGVDDVHVGDPALTDHSWSRLGSFVREDLVVLDGTAAPGVHPPVIEALAVPDRNRPDAAEAMIRLEHSRERFARLPLPESGGQPRPAGSVTVQLPTAERYSGEVAITLQNLPDDERAAVVGSVRRPMASRLACMECPPPHAPPSPFLELSPKKRSKNASSRPITRCFFSP